jgi:hypothetical protein
MYLLYRKSSEGEAIRFDHPVPVNLFGCRHGYLYRFLHASLQVGAVQPPGWHLDIARSLAAEGKDGYALVIDLKPKLNMSFYELVQAWGHSDAEWTPILMHLRGLIVDKPFGTFARDSFPVPRGQEDEPTFSLMYLNGGIAEGELKGRWVPPGRSSTNSVLLSAHMFTYFADKVNKVLSERE